ncbi:hypothetical protein C0J52_12057, partial [Blattella germanica]
CLFSPFSKSRSRSRCRLSPIGLKGKSSFKFIFIFRSCCYNTWCQVDNCLFLWPLFNAGGHCKCLQRKNFRVTKL